MASAARRITSCHVWSNNVTTSHSDIFRLRSSHEGYRSIAAVTLLTDVRCCREDTVMSTSSALAVNCEISYVDGWADRRGFQPTNRDGGQNQACRVGGVK